MRYPSGLGGRLPARGDDLNVWSARVALALPDQPLGSTAPCMNPECAGPVDRLTSTRGPLVLYCSRYCRNRAGALRRSAEQQLAVVDDLLSTKKAKGEYRTELTQRRAMLRWWLARLRPPQP